MSILTSECTCSEYFSSSVTFMRRNVPPVLWRCWLGGRKGIRPVKNWVVGCWRGYLSGASCRQRILLPLTVSCFSKIQIGFTFLVPAHLGSPGKRPLNGCVYVCVTFMRRKQVYAEIVFGMNSASDPADGASPQCSKGLLVGHGGAALPLSSTRQLSFTAFNWCVRLDDAVAS